MTVDRMFRRLLAEAAGPPETDADETRRVTAHASALGVPPILAMTDLKFESMRPLDLHEPLLRKWLRGKRDIGVCVRSGGGGTEAWVLAPDPWHPDAEAVRAMLDLKGWNVVVRPTTRSVMVRSAKGSDLSPSEAETAFRELIGEALDANASDVHFEVRGAAAATRFRVDGEMRDVTGGNARPRYSRPVVEKFGNYMFNSLAKRGSRQFNTMAPLNAAAQMVVAARTVALRFSTAPDIRGFDIFVRVWRPDQTPLDLHALGYGREHIEFLAKAVRRPYGVIVFSGPTGSGKSSSLTALLDDLGDDEKKRRKIVSLEEPVERELPHVTHVSVSSVSEVSGGWTTLLAGLNRWDSNINVLGEIKDADSAKALEGVATSGKLTLTTLHTSNAITIPSRMEELGVEHRHLHDATFLVLLVNQRLLPRLCGVCRVPLWSEYAEDPPPGAAGVSGTHGVERARQHRADHAGRVERYRLMFPEPTEVHLRGPGCDQCGWTGISGRLLVAEMIAVGDRDREFIGRRDWDGWREALREDGWRPIGQDVLRRVCAGETDPADAERLACDLPSEAF